MKKPKLPSAEIDFLELKDQIEENGSNSALSDGLFCPRDISEALKKQGWFIEKDGSWNHDGIIEEVKISSYSWIDATIIQINSSK